MVFPGDNQGPSARRRFPTAVGAAAVVAMVLSLPGCASAPAPEPPVAALPRLATASTPPAPAVPPAVPVLAVADPVAKKAPDPVTDAEVARAQEALRDALEWGAQYYEGPLYAAAKAYLDEAVAARDTDPAQCRALLAEASQAAASGKAAALRDYEKDVSNRFETSRAQLVEVRADRAFPQEYARLVASLDTVASLFGVGSYGAARVEAYHTLKGMSDLYDTVNGLRRWLADARVRTEAALAAAEAQGAARWAPALVKDARQKYQDAVAQAQADDLAAAVDSMKAAGQLVGKLPYVREDTAEANRGPASGSVPSESVPSATAQLVDQPAPSSSLPNPGVNPQPPSAASLLAGNRVRIGNLGMGALDGPGKWYLAAQAEVARFDVVAAAGLRNPAVMEKVLAGLDDTWQAAVSRNGYFGFLYQGNRVQMVKELGSYTGSGKFVHAPYAAQFRLAGTRFAVNLVICQSGADETARLPDIYRYFESLTGNHGITLVLVGGAGRQPTYAGTALRPLVQGSGPGKSAADAAWVTLGAPANPSTPR